MSTIKVNKIEKRSGSTLELGGPGTAVTLACGATQTGFGRTGTVDWCTTAKTSPFTSVSGKGYFVNTTGGVVTVTLPASPSAGDIVSIKDYAGTFNTNNVTVGRNSSKIGSQCLDATLSTEGDSITLVYVDGTQGWLNIQTDDTVQGATFVTATGGTITTSGDFKIHTFTSDANFVVSNAGNEVGSNKLSYMVVGGGGSGRGAGGGAGGFREGKCSSDPYADSPLDSGTALTASAQTYPITVGAGGAGGNPGYSTSGNNGSNSVFSTITSAGGGTGGAGPSTPSTSAGSGGSGGGAGNTPSGSGTIGSGNTPPVSPPQGNNGGTSSPGPGNAIGMGGGGGASAVGTNGTQGPSSAGNAGSGGAGVATSITASPVTRAGGGGGGAQGTSPNNDLNNGGAGGGGSGGTGGATLSDGNGSANTGGGGGGVVGNPCSISSGSGGSGIVVIRYKFQN